MSDLQTLPWRDAAATQPNLSVRVLTADDSGRIGMDVWTGSTWYPANPGSIITHWCPLDAIPRPAAPKPAEPPLKSQIVNRKS